MPPPNSERIRKPWYPFRRLILRLTWFAYTDESTPMRLLPIVLLVAHGAGTLTLREASAMECPATLFSKPSARAFNAPKVFASRPPSSPTSGSSCNQRMPASGHSRLLFMPETPIRSSSPRTSSKPGISADIGQRPPQPPSNGPSPNGERSVGNSPGKSPPPTGLPPVPLAFAIPSPKAFATSISLSRTIATASPRVPWPRSISSAFSRDQNASGQLSGGVSFWGRSIVPFTLTEIPS